MSAGGFQEPANLPARILASSWWAIVIIMYAVYTGNLIAFLTVAHRKMPFNTLKDMVQQTVYEFGLETGIVQHMLFKVRVATGNCIVI